MIVILINIPIYKVSKLGLTIHSSTARPEPLFAVLHHPYYSSYSPHQVASHDVVMLTRSTSGAELPSTNLVERNELIS